jgi:hypothetical protein
MASDVSDRLRRQIIERAYHVCEYCLVHEMYPTVAEIRT